jgi:hypothetical protein
MKIVTQKGSTFKSDIGKWYSNNITVLWHTLHCCRQKCEIRHLSELQIDLTNQSTHKYAENQKSIMASINLRIDKLIAYDTISGLNHDIAFWKLQWMLSFLFFGILCSRVLIVVVHISILLKLMITQFATTFWYIMIKINQGFAQIILTPSSHISIWMNSAKTHSLRFKRWINRLIRQSVKIARWYDIWRN